MTERVPPELLIPREPVPPGRWIRVAAGVLGAIAAGFGGTRALLLTCVDEDCIGFLVAWFLVGPILGAALAFTLTLDIQRWRARRRRDA